MKPAYRTESRERRYRGGLLIVENRVPGFQTWEEHEKAKKEIGERLYDVFCKYASTES